MATFPQLVEVISRQEWRAWLEANHQQTASVLLVTYRKGSDERYIPYQDLVEEALCFGWIDSTKRTLDDGRSTLQMSPRKPRSGWSAINKERVERLIAEGRMTPAGMAAIERAQQDGSWSRLDASDALLVPDDLAHALDAAPDAAANFAAFPSSSRKVMLQWVYDARRPETRARRIDEIVTRAARNERAR